MSDEEKLRPFFYLVFMSAGVIILLYCAIKIMIIGQSFWSYIWLPAICALDLITFIFLFCSKEQIVGGFFFRVNDGLLVVTAVVAIYIALSFSKGFIVAILSFAFFYIYRKKAITDRLPQVIRRLQAQEENNPSSE